MKNIIDQIIEMDRQAQKITQAARLEKLNADRDIARRAEALRSEYLERARKRAQINCESERTIAEQKWQRTQKKYQKQEAALDAVFQNESERLADELVARVLGGDRS